MAHTTLMKYHPYSKLYLFTCAWLLLTAIIAAARDGDADVRLSILILTCFIGLMQWVFLFTVAYEITSILGIAVFVTKQTQERRKQALLATLPAEKRAELQQLKP